MQDPTIDYSLQRLSKMIPKHADDPDRLSKETILKRTADLLEQCYTMSGNPHHFALPTPPSDHENDSGMFRLSSFFPEKYLLGICILSSSPSCSLLHVIIRRYQGMNAFQLWKICYCLSCDFFFFLNVRREFH